MLLEMALFHSFLWLNSIPLCVYVCVYRYICVYVCIYIMHTTSSLSVVICQGTFRLLPCLGYCK